MTHEQVDELRELKRQETNLHRKISRTIKRNPNSQWLSVMIDERNMIIEKMKPLRDQLLSELADVADRLTLAFIRMYYGGKNSFEVADMFGYRDGQAILYKIKKAESQVISDEQ